MDQYTIIIKIKMNCYDAPRVNASISKILISRKYTPSIITKYVEKLGAMISVALNEETIKPFL